MENRKARALLLAAVTVALPMLLLAACGGKQEVMVLQDITYARADGIELKLDMARPRTGKGPFPALVFIHGGGFGLYPGGGKRDFEAAIAQAAERGYVAVTIDHRSLAVAEAGVAKYPFPAQIYDAKKAVRWLRANAKEYRIDPGHIGAIGYSSGGYIALMLGLTTESDGLEGLTDGSIFPSSVQAAVNLAGTIEALEADENDGLLVTFLGGTIKEVPEKYQAASLLSHVRKTSPPALTIQGDLDTDSPLKLSEMLDRKFKQAGASHTLIVKKGAGHGEAQLFFEDESVWHFLDTNLKRRS